MAASTALASPPQTAPRRYTVSLTRDERDIRAAQRLRHEVFAGELGASLTTPEAGLDADAFDDHCDHLLVREEGTGAVVGTYRLLPPAQATAVRGLYAETEFNLGGLTGIRHDLVEAGRSCVHPDHRDGAVISLMWAGIARYMTQAGHDWLGGCCSVPLADGGALATSVWETVSAKHLSPEEYRVTPRLPWRPTSAPSGRIPLPPLLRGYVRLGAWVCGEPAYDPDFGVADFYVLLSVRRADPRYLSRFLSLASAP
ncbi:GNAT family N-acetyltransferase [Streptomyces cavernae]|uniref:GNAT family N-acetyltransferase n=1 Tax=Streptomyces cavernae TaxID=2259034 RepID=UPI000FEB663E|nr:GNAT family N-acyltransferase [Streptomyces cavernae]